MHLPNVSSWEPEQVVRNRIWARCNIVLIGERRAVIPIMLMAAYIFRVLAPVLHRRDRLGRDQVEYPPDIQHLIQIRRQRMITNIVGAESWNPPCRIGCMLRIFQRRHAVIPIVLWRVVNRLRERRP